MSDIQPWVPEQSWDAAVSLGPHLKAGTLSISTELLDDYSLSSKVVENMMVDLMHDMFDTMKNGPKLGPGRNELWKIQRPGRVRRNILSNLADVMPGKRPGKFVRAKT
jgi:hypothetical protein